MVQIATRSLVGRNAPRSKTGCSTCLKRKIKCDEQRPNCQRCTSLELSCEWTARTRKPRTVFKAKENTTQRSIRLLESKQDQPQNDALSRADSEPSTVQVSTNNQVLNWLLGSNSSSTPSIRNFAPSISLSLSTEHIPCANSLLLSAQDRRCFEYFPSCTMVSGYLKPWRWSNLSYIYQKTAPNDAIVMRMILAMSGSEMHRLKVGGCSDSEDIGLHHYNLAVRDLSMVLGKDHSDDPKQRLERLLAALLFMVDYEVRFGYSRHHLRLHLEGARSLYASYEKSIMDSERSGTLSTIDEEKEGEDSHLSLLGSLLLLWISYIDAIGGQGLSSQSLLSQISQSSLPSIKLERLYRRARISGRHCWGEEYPEDAILDDVENYRPLEFLHHGLLMRSRIWQLAVARHGGKDVTETPESLFEELMEIGERYQDLVLTSRLSGAGQYRRVYGTIRCAASVYWANVLFHRLTLRKQQAPTKLHRTAVSSIMQIAYTDYGRDTSTLAMQVWGMFMAGVETEDGIHRDWILERLAELGGMHFESRWTTDVMERLIRERKGMGESGVDLMPLLTLDCS
ncbi:hypothetical protein V500_10978 [Pseudogymnoascus sp. VKM F-4518 (FW-2643)]|nr:hypothetical protein V500_10978 [Pseudogymnoascus sp. VKM F-4518 (FW-2643)]